MVTTKRLKSYCSYKFLVLFFSTASQCASFTAFHSWCFRPQRQKQSPGLVSALQLSQTDKATDIWSESQLLEYATNQGINMTLNTLGPGYRAVARSTQNASQILGYCEGFIRPAGSVLHLDKMEVFQKMVTQAKKDNPDFVKGGTLFGPGLLLGFLCLLHGRDKGCTIAEFLAIDDEEKQHRRLVRYYERSGFKIVKYVGDDFADIPDRMVWGGCGTLMKENIDTLLQQWTAMLESAQKKA